MLSQKLALWDVQDVEGLCASAVPALRNRDLEHYEHEDLLSYLVETAWELSLEFDPGECSFSRYLRIRLPQRAVDWKRSTGRTRWTFANRTYERTLPVFTTLDDRPDNADSAGTVDVDRVRELDLGRLLGTRGSGPARRNGEMGTAPDKRAA